MNHGVKLDEQGVVHTMASKHARLRFMLGVECLRQCVHCFSVGVLPLFINQRWRVGVFQSVDFAWVAATSVPVTIILLFALAFRHKTLFQYGFLFYAVWVWWLGAAAVWSKDWQVASIYLTFGWVAIGAFYTVSKE